jgi:hypothetical protein
MRFYRNGIAIRICTICKKPLSVYNKTGECFYHNYKGIADTAAVLPTVCGSRPMRRHSEFYRLTSW